MYYPAPRVNPAAKEGMYPEHASSFPKLYLAGGVTRFARPAASSRTRTSRSSTPIDAGKSAGPKMNVTGPYLEGPGTFAPQMHQLTGPDDARKTVEFWISKGRPRSRRTCTSRGPS